MSIAYGDGQNKEKKSATVYLFAQKLTNLHLFTNINLQTRSAT